MIRNLVLKSVKSMKEILGNDNVTFVDPAMVAEDFGEYGRTKRRKYDRPVRLEGSIKII